MAARMKALSLRQPWANAVLYLGKSIENRRWNTSFRGEFLIHASKGMTREEYDDAIDFCVDVLGDDRLVAHRDVMRGEALQRGGIVGRARIVDVIRPCGRDALFPCEHPWHMPEQYGFVLADVTALPFVPCRGELGFFDVAPEVMAGCALDAALAAAGLDAAAREEVRRGR